MARPRGKPFIYATWLSRVMSGATVCHWQYWYQTHHRLTARQPSDFDAVNWQLAHTRLLTEVRQELSARQLRLHAEFECSFRLPGSEALITGKIDCLAVDGSTVTVYDCKTGRPRDHDQLQVMIYMYALSTYPRYAANRIRGCVVYRDRRIEIPYLPEGFADHLAYFAGLLSGRVPPSREPGRDCRFCSITAADCPDRADERERDDGNTCV